MTLNGTTPSVDVSGRGGRFAPAFAWRPHAGTNDKDRRAPRGIPQIARPQSRAARGFTASSALLFHSYMVAIEFSHGAYSQRPPSSSSDHGRRRNLLVAPWPDRVPRSFRDGGVPL